MESLGGWRSDEEQGYLISHEWIYQYIYQDKYQGGQLYQYLCCQKKRKKRYGSYDRRGQIPNQRMIDERPAIVDRRNRIGDWEGDTIVGKGYQGVLISLNERKSLRKDIAAVESWSKFANIGLMPLLVIVGGLVIGWRRTRRRAVAREG